MRYLLLIFFLSGCGTTMGLPTLYKGTVDWSDDQVKLDLCLMRDPDVSMKRVQHCSAVLSEHLSSYGIHLNMVGVWDYNRPAFSIIGLSRDMQSRHLPKPCDRMMYLVGAKWYDTAWEILSYRLPLGNVYGYVDDTRTKGYAIAETMGPAHAVMGPLFSGPYGICAVFIHEVEHQLGCDHGLTRTDCYQAIESLKMNSSDDFWPGFTISGGRCWSREECDRHAAEIYGWSERDWNEARRLYYE